MVLSNYTFLENIRNYYKPYGFCDVIYANNIIVYKTYVSFIYICFLQIEVPELGVLFNVLEEGVVPTFSGCGGVVETGPAYNDTQMVLNILYIHIQQIFERIMSRI